MTYSPLTDEVMPPTGRYNGSVKWQARPSGVKIDGLNVHHHATTGTGGIARLVTSNDPASANYIIRTNGSLIGSVPEQYRAWTTSSYAADDDKITVEVQNSTGAPTWEISAAAMDTLVRLYADIARRYGFTPDRSHIFGHRDYFATACPGPYLYPRLGEVAMKAAALDTGPTPGGFPMALTSEEQDALKTNVGEIETIVRQCKTKLERIEQGRALDLAHMGASSERERDTLAAVQALAATVATLTAKVDQLLTE